VVPRVSATVVEDQRSRSLQLMLRGTPDRVLELCNGAALTVLDEQRAEGVGVCTEFWDGESIRPMTPVEASLILERYELWAHNNDMHCIAYAYPPALLSFA
jgi:hypothetical protein